MLEGVILGDRYQLIEQLGGGGMAVVYKARCNVLNRFVAVKILREDYINDAEIVGRFKAEAQAAAKLSHPNIVSVYDVGEEGKYLYFVMECIQGLTLKQIIDREGPLYYEDVVHFGIQIAGALEHAHQNGLIHRDIKPHNIMVTEDGVAKVTDFGIARATNTASTLTNLGKAIGSVHYFSPEQATGGIVDARSDIYSVGITLFEMATGTLPFDAETPVSIALKHLNEPATAAKVINNDIPIGLNDIIMKCIRKDPNHRYQNCAELIEDFYKVLDNPNEQISDTTKTENTKKAVRVGAIKNNMDEDDSFYNDMKKDSASAKNRERNKGSVDKETKKKKILIISVAVAFVLVIAAIIIALLSRSNAEIGRITVGNYVGQRYDDVIATLQRENPDDWDWIQAQIQQETTQDAESEAGTILEQEPSEGTQIEQGGHQKLILSVSTGATSVSIPSFYGKTVETYSAELASLGFEVSVEKSFSSTVAKGEIISTSPESGTDDVYEQGTAVLINVSKGERVVEVTVPNLSGMTYSEVVAALESANLKIGTITPTDAKDDTLAVDTQTPLAGDKAEKDSMVNVTFKTTSTMNYTVDTTQFDQAANSQKVLLSTALIDDDVDFSTVSFTTVISYVTSDTGKSYVLKKGRVTYSELPLAFTNLNVPVGGYVTISVSITYRGTVYTYKEVKYAE